MIIAGYQGIGKSYTIEQEKIKVFEIESSEYTKENLWQVRYVDDILYMHDRVTPDSVIFISTHPIVINELARRGVPIMIVVPNIFDKDQFLNRLYARMTKTNLGKDVRAYDMALKNYEDDILNITRRGYPNAIPYELKVGNFLLDEFEEIKEVHKKYIKY